MSLGDRPGVYTLLNHNNGTMQMQRNQRVRLRRRTCPPYPPAPPKGRRLGPCSACPEGRAQVTLMRLQVLLEIADKVAKDSPGTAVLLDGVRARRADPAFVRPCPGGDGARLTRGTRQSSLLNAVHSARLARRRLRRASTSRKLLEEPEDSMDAMKEDTHLAERIRAVGKFRSTGAVASTASGNVEIFGQRQWKMLAHEDFHQETVEGWKNKGDAVDLPPDNSISECSSQKHTYSDFFLGAFTNMETSKVGSCLTRADADPARPAAAVRSPPSPARPSSCPRTRTCASRPGSTSSTTGRASPCG